jgi:hypothetical protein
MQSRRIFSVPARRPASLVPIYLAILCLVSLGTLGFAIASWPHDPGHSSPARDTVESLSESRPLGDVKPFPIDERKAPHVGKWT